MIVKAGSTDVTTYIVLRKAADGTELTGATITNIDLVYTRSGADHAAKVDATALAAVDSAHGDSKAIEVDATSAPGLYRVDWPDAAFAVAVREVILTVIYATALTVHLRVELSPQVDTVAISGDTVAADNCEADYDGTGYAGGTIVKQADVTKLLGTAWLAPAVAGTPDVNAKQVGGLAIASGAIPNAVAGAASGLAIVGSSMIVPNTQKVDVETIKTQAVTCGAGVTIGAYVGGTGAAALASEVTAARMGALTDLIDGGRLDLILDTIQADTDLLDDAIGGLADIHTDVGAVKTDTAAILIDTAEIGAAGVGLTAIPDLAGVTTLLTRLSATRATYLDYLFSIYFGMVSAVAQAQAGAAGSVTLAAGASAVNDFYKGQIIVIYTGAGAGQARACYGYTGATKVALTRPNWAVNPDNTSWYVIITAGSAVVAAMDDIDFGVLQKVSLNAATPAVTVSDKTGFKLSSDGADLVACDVATVGDTPTLLLTKIQAIWNRLFTKKTVTATTETAYEKDDTTAMEIFTLADDDTTASRTR